MLLFHLQHSDLNIASNLFPLAANTFKTSNKVMITSFSYRPVLIEKIPAEYSRSFRIRIVCITAVFLYFLAGLRKMALQSLRPTTELVLRHFGSSLHTLSYCRADGRFLMLAPPPPHKAGELLPAS